MDKKKVFRFCGRTTACVQGAWSPVRVGFSRVPAASRRCAPHGPESCLAGAAGEGEEGRKRVLGVRPGGHAVYRRVPQCVTRLSISVR